jgi:hypothetical protein
MTIQTRSSGKGIASFDAHIVFSTGLPRGWCQLADTGIALLALTGKGRTTFSEALTPRTLLYQSLTQAPRGRAPCGTLLALGRVAILQLSLVFRAQLFSFLILVGVR